MSTYPERQVAIPRLKLLNGYGTRKWYMLGSPASQVRRSKGKTAAKVQNTLSQTSRKDTSELVEAVKH